MRKILILCGSAAIAFAIKAAIQLSPIADVSIQHMICAPDLIEPHIAGAVIALPRFASLVSGHDPPINAAPVLSRQNRIVKADVWIEARANKSEDCNKMMYWDGLDCISLSLLLFKSRRILC